MCCYGSMFGDMPLVLGLPSGKDYGFVSLVGCFLFPVVGLYLLVSKVTFAQAVGGCGVWFSFDYYPVCASGFGLSILCPMCGLGLFDWYACWFFVSGCCPFSYVYRGGAVRFSLSLEALVSYILGCLWGIALLIINS